MSHAQITSILWCSLKGARKRKGNHEIFRTDNFLPYCGNPSISDVPVCDPLWISIMNEIITKEMIDGGFVPDVVFDKLEEYKSAVEWFETFKYQFKKICEETGINKWETDYFFLNYIPDGSQIRVDTKRMKETNVFILNAQTGELEEVNAYEYFCKTAPVKAHVSYKEKK